MNEPTARPPRSRALGDITAAVILTAGAAIERKRAGRAHGHRAWLAAIPIIGVNFVAFYGQLSFFRSHRIVLAGSAAITIPGPVSVAISLSLECIAIYLAWQAHIARKAGDSALRLRLAAYAVALGIGALNYSHFCGPGWRPNAFAVAFAVASVISPALWGVHSNRESRDDLKAQGLIEEHAVRLGFTRSFFHPLLSWVVRSRAAWTGENRPAEAIKLVDPPKWARAKDPARPAVTDPVHELIGELIDRLAGLETRIAQTPPPAPRPVREPRPVRAGRAARAAGLAAAPAVTLAALSDAERAIALSLLGAEKLPSVRQLARTAATLPGVESTRRRAAARILEVVKSGRNGHNSGGDGHGVDNES